MAKIKIKIGSKMALKGSGRKPIDGMVKRVPPQTTRPPQISGGMKKISDMIKGAARNPADYMNKAKPSKTDNYMNDYVRKAGRFESAGSRAGAAVDRGVAKVGSYANRAKGYAMDVAGTARSKATKVVKQVKKSERSAAYQVGKLITGQTKNQNANRRAGRIGYAGIAATGTAIGSLGAHAVNRSREKKESSAGVSDYDFVPIKYTPPAKSSMGNETSQNYNSSSWSSHKKTQRGY